MGLFSNLLKKNGNTNKPIPNTSIKSHDWVLILLQLNTELRNLREQWFSTMATGIQQNAGANVRNHTISGDGDLSVNIYQLIWTCWFVTSNEYILPNRQQEFTNILYADLIRIYGEKKVFELINRYRSKEDNVITADFVLGSDVVKFALGINEDPDLIPATVVANSLGDFRELLFMIIADAFGDIQSVLKIKERLKI